MSKDGIKIFSALGSSAVFAGGIAWLSSAPWWVIIISTIGGALLLVVLFFMAVINKLLSGI